MLAICKYRGTIKQYEENPLIVKIMKEVMDADAPIADNKMFNVMASFAFCDINADVAIHSFTIEIDTRFLMKLFDVDLLNRNYFAFHTQYPEWCVRSLLELKELPEEIFDPNYRLKMAIKEYREKKYK